MRSATKRTRPQHEDRNLNVIVSQNSAVLRIDMNSGTILEANRSALMLSGYEERDLVGKQIGELAALPDVQVGLGDAPALSSTRSYVIHHLRKKNGAIVLVEIAAGRILPDDTEQLVLLIRDIGEISSMERALIESEEMFRNLAESSPNMIWINRGGVIVYANKQCEDTMGYTRVELYSSSFDFMCLIAPGDRKRAIANFQKHATGKEVEPFEYVCVTKSGKLIDSVIATRLITFNAGRAVLGIVTDISQLKRTENRLKVAAAELREQKKELQEKNAALREVLSQIESEKSLIKKKIVANTERLLMPLLRKLNHSIGPSGEKHLESLEKHIRDLTSSFGLNLSHKAATLSSTQIEICDMIRSGSSTKDIANQFHISVRTVDTQRNRIRKKLGISGTKTNLSSYLRLLEADALD